MPKIYKYHYGSFQFMFGLLFVGLVALFGMMLLLAALSSENLSDRLVTMGLGLLFLFFSLRWVLLVFGMFNVTTSDRGLIIRNALTTRSINWDEITEFGTHRRIACYQYVRVFYLKAKSYGDRKITVCGESIGDLDALLEEVFQKAVNARFVRIENLALIPFTRKMKTIPWKRND
jgi:hypothetical protein